MNAIQTVMALALVAATTSAMATTAVKTQTTPAVDAAVVQTVVV